MATSISTEQLIEELKACDLKFRRAARQVLLLDAKLTDLHARYNRAYHDNDKRYRVTLRLQILVAAGTRNMYQEYVTRMADRCEEMQDRLVESGDMSETEESYNWDDYDGEYQ